MLKYDGWPIAVEVELSFHRYGHILYVTTYCVHTSKQSERA